MNLEQLKEEARKDLVVENEEHLDSESLKNQKIKAKYLEHKTRYQLLLQKANGDYQRMYREKWEYYGGKADVKVVSGDRYREIGVLEVSKASSFENFESRIGLCASDRAKSTMAETCQQAR